MIGKWDMRFLGLAQHFAGWSKDPRTKVGAVLVSPDRSVVVPGYNGFARGCRDDAEIYADRTRKLRRVIHAEANALLVARRDLTGYTLYTVPLPPCAPCAAMVIQCGVARVVAAEPDAGTAARWADDLAEAAAMYAEAGVALELVKWGAP